MELSKERKEFLAFAAISIIVISLFALFLFGFTGLRVFIAALFISLPFYLILNNFNFSEAEKVIFSMLLGFVLFSALAYWIGFLIPFKFSIVVVFIILIVISFIIKKFRPKNKQNAQQ